MCGICCIIYADEEEKNTNQFAEDFECSLRCRGPDFHQKFERRVTDELSIKALGCTLHLRGPKPVPQPLVHPDGSFLLWNGEIYDGFQISDEENDGEVLFERLNACEDEEQLLSTFSRILGPWAFIYWQARAGLFWFGRDVLGRRSLLWNYPSISSKSLTLSSVVARPALGSENLWSEVPFLGVFCLRSDFSLQLFPWSSLSLQTQSLSNYTISEPLSIRSPVLAPFEARIPSELQIEELYGELPIPSQFINGFGTEKIEDAFRQLSLRFEEVLERAVRRRVLNRPQTCKNCVGDRCEHPKVALLFSGGLDSTVLALLANRFVPETEAIDLLNVSFSRDLSSGNAQMAPDRKSGLEALTELRNLFPNRTWNFVQVNVSKSEMETQCSRVIADLIFPLNTVLDKDIGCALWFASRGEGTLYPSQQPYTSAAKVLLTGMGADEQLGGYSRHRLCFKRGSWAGLIGELQMEMGRIAARNMGRDDRVISSHGREARFPFLDEELVAFLNALPIHHKVNLNLQPGFGDKFLLRHLAHRLGLRAPAFLAKRAIQFGSKIAKMETGLKGDQLCEILTHR